MQYNHSKIHSEKFRDPSSFTIPVTIVRLSVGKALLDLGASINLMPLSMMKQIGEVEIRPTRMALQSTNKKEKLLETNLKTLRRLRNSLQTPKEFTQVQPFFLRHKASHEFAI